MSQPPIQSPWPNLPESQATKVHSNISSNCLRYIKSVYPVHGIVTTIIQRTFAAIESDLRSRGYTTFNPEQDAEIFSVICHCTSARINPGTSGGHDAGTVTPIYPAHEVAAQQSADVLETVEGRGGLGRVGGSKTKKDRLEKIKNASEKYSKRLP